MFTFCYYSQFYMVISTSLWKIETKNLNLDPRISIFFVLGTKSAAAYSLSKHSSPIIGSPKNVCKVSRRYYMRGTWLRTGYNPVFLNKKHVNKVRA